MNRNNRILERFQESIRITQFNAVKISIASPEKIKSLSYGEVKKIETINYRTFRPEKDGLFCPRIFGPTQDWACVCGKYKRMKHRGIVCEKCGVEVIESRVRRERMGHIELVTPVVHLWYLRETPSYLSLILNMTIKDIEKVVYFEGYMVVSQGISPYPQKTILNNHEYKDYIDNHPEDISFKAEMGAAAIKMILEKMDLNLEIILAKANHDKASSLLKVKLMRRIKVLTQLQQAKIRPEWMILTTLPVLPPDLRPLVPLDGGRFASSDLNELYRRVINRNLRLKRLIEIQAPSVIIKNEQRILQESVDALIDNSRKAQPIRLNKRPLKSLSEMLRGKQGRFRQNLLGKRVDYSARSVIVVDPTLKIDECGIPLEMAIELFAPHIKSQLIKRGIASNIRMARKMTDSDQILPVVVEILEDILETTPVLLNRAPTLHRLGIQAFKAKLIKTKAITIHPLVTVAFGADFDGDQMGVYIPLSKNAILEAKKLMMSSVNLLSPQNGRPALVPHQEIVLGIYYLTKQRKNLPGHNSYYASFEAVRTAYECYAVHIHTCIHVLDRNQKVIETTVGRVLFSFCLPEKYEFEKINKVFNKQDILKLVEDVYFAFGHDQTIAMLDKVKEAGFYYATKSGFTFSYEYLIDPDNREDILKDAEKDAHAIEKSFTEGLITSKERYNKLLQIWDSASNKLSQNMINNLEDIDKKVCENNHNQSLQKHDDFVINTPRECDEFNFLYACLDSRSRGSRDQIKQIIAMRGLMQKPSGEIIEHPVKSNFKKGLSIFEYFTSTHGARKGQADTALKTANAGYLTRRLVDVAQDIIITSEDCGTREGLWFDNLIDNGDVILPLADRVYGRILAMDVCDRNNNILLAEGTLIDKSNLDCFKKNNITKIKLRSPIKCQLKYGVCAKCYGIDLSRNALVLLGTAVGIIAAQSIGEPGTQLTLRTFHIGGTASFTDTSSFVAKKDGKVILENVQKVTNKNNKQVVVGRKGHLVVVDKDNLEIQRHKIEYGSLLHVNNDDFVKQGDVLIEWDTSNAVIISEMNGTVEYQDIINNITVQSTYDEVTKKNTIVVIDQKSDKYEASILIHASDKNAMRIQSKQYHLPIGAILVVEQDAQVAVGDVIAKIPLESVKAKDITTGGLPKIAELFEARMIKDPCILSEISGEVVIGSLSRGMRKISIVNNDVTVDYLISKNKQLLVYNGDFVGKGDQLTAGNPVLQDLLKIKGIDYLQLYLVNQLQIIYKNQAQNINDRHFELIIKQMTRKVKITDPGATSFLIGEKIDRNYLENINAVLVEEGKAPAQYINELMGITIASLDTESFLAAASFQETTKVLAEAAVSGAIDHLRGPKENVIIGREISAGTGIDAFKKSVFSV
jgi:DNA-directed RNA polymerase subunit beta'